MQNRYGQPEPLSGIVAGLIAGAAAAAAMNLFQRACSRMLLGYDESHGAQSLQKGGPDHGAAAMLRKRNAEDPTDDSAERLAQTLSVGLTDRKLTKDERRRAGTAFHYSYGMSMGAVYGAAAEYVPGATIGAGLPYGALIWLGADEVVVPALGLSQSAADYPLSVHATALASHLVYGLTLEGTRRAVRKLL